MTARPPSRRTAIDRWIIGLTPLFAVVTERTEALCLGEPSASFGPSLMGKHLFDGRGDRIRKGAVWWIEGKNCGFHVDFLRQGIRVEAWIGTERRVSADLVGKVSEASLTRDLTVCMEAAGLTDLARTDEVRRQLFKQREARK